MKGKPNTLLSVTGLRKRFGGREVVRGVSLDILEGEIVAVIGPNGAGKSTTLDLALGLKRPDEGTVAYWRDDYRTHVGVQLQSTPFFPGLGAADNLKLFAAFYRKPLTREQGERLLRLCGLQDVADTEASRLSGGQQKRLAIAVALVHEPRLAFLDEPTAALDPKARRDIHSLIRTLNESGVSVVFTSHDMEEVHRLAHRIVFIEAGRVAAEGTPEELCARFGTDDIEDVYMMLAQSDAGSEGGRSA
ncbi:ABC transporter ATP-binding protein [Paenibacillus flagellatus]|uniref:ABC transporter ATP-binding protein n=1 Tax=Paenibacillus flagellatus TaxID=2211139 RepID=A0A2V5JV08_9BACL|nr:ABC transporter ATP-binding protein [Paenibacillus flagellatus]PYI50489.1 ABC transporter ATP-binding protein [Paenibacillus flagellatus]